MALVDIWILEVKEVQRAAHGMSKTFGLERAAAHQLLSALPCRVKRDVEEGQADRWNKKLRAFGAIVGWGPAGSSTPPLPVVKVPPNEAPAPAVDIPPMPETFDGKGTLTYYALGAIGLLIAVVARVVGSAPTSGQASWVTAAAMGIGLALLAMGIVGALLAAFFQLGSPSPGVLALVGVLMGAPPIALRALTEPDAADWQAEAAALRSAILAGQVPEARQFVGGGGIFESSNAAQSSATVEALYEAGARRVFAQDDDGDGEAEWLGIDMPVLPARRSSIAGAYRSYAGADFNEVPATFRAPSNQRHWIVPVDIH